MNVISQAQGKLSLVNPIIWIPVLFLLLPDPPTETWFLLRRRLQRLPVAEAEGGEVAEATGLEEYLDSRGTQVEDNSTKGKTTDNITRIFPSAGLADFHKFETKHHWLDWDYNLIIKSKSNRYV
jgi:hypothetical protein